MIKKSGIVLIGLLYLITATGFALNLHFCGSIIESVKIDAPMKKCGMDSRCCKNTHLEVKVKDAHQVAHTVFTSTFLVSVVPVLRYASFHAPLTIDLQQTFFLKRGPPPNPVPVFIQNCTFRI